MSDLAEDQLALAVAYHREFPDEIDHMIAENERPLERLKQEFPTIDTIVVDRAGMRLMTDGTPSACSASICSGVASV